MAGHTPFPPADPINPPHYKGAGGLEVIDVIEAFGLQHDYYSASAIKYILRAGKKAGCPAPEDAKKAIWFLNRAIAVWDEDQKRQPLVPVDVPDHLADGIDSGRD